MQEFPSERLAGSLEILRVLAMKLLRQWYHRFAQLFTNFKKYRRCIAIDETKIKIGNRYWYVWAAIDVDTWEILGVMVTKWRTSIDVIQLVRRILMYCENKPLILVDRGPWYRWTLQSLGLQHEYETFGERNAIEGWFKYSKVKAQKGSGNVFLSMLQRKVLKVG